MVVAAHAATTTAITIDGTQGGRTFDGIGAISGGGGNSRLLADYPEPQRSQILDYLFKPGYGAALQILKVEIGGDTNSTDGAEPSHMHTATDLGCNRGYEWWLMAQAKARNPAIKLAALSWGAPGWVGGPTHTFWTTDTINYLIKWLDCAASHHLTIDYIGGWNERSHDKTWYENFHAALAAHYPKVKLVGDDAHNWIVADDMAADPTFAKAVDIVGTHYPCGKGDDTGTTCTNNANANASGKQLWASEGGSVDFNTGAGAVARSINRGYLDSHLTAYLNWPVVAAITPNLLWATMGLALAREPWSGAYSVGQNAWVTAHTTQFTAPGWKYIDSASGYLGGNRANGSYVTLKSPNRKDFSTIVETTAATAGTTLNFTVTGGLSTGTVHVWSTKLGTTNPNDVFQHTTDITPKNGAFSLTATPGRVYSLTTTTGQGKGTAKGARSAALALPYSDNFDGYAAGHEARYLADMDGAFEAVTCGARRSGMCIRQMANQLAVVWRKGSRDPSALLGDVGWTNYTLSCDVLLEHAGYVELQSRVGTQTKTPSNVNAYFFRVSDTGAWSIIKSSTAGTSGTLSTLASGTTKALGTNKWHTLALSVHGSTITASVDGTVVRTLTNGSYSAGQVGIATSQTINAQFDNLSVKPN
ncbi:MAG: galactosylceramidase [Actinobacteria bacterium]|nr:MAG: galactosylceramidase [Actinomycetota bacterium]